MTPLSKPPGAGQPVPSSVHCVTVCGVPVWPSVHWIVSPGLIWIECGCAQPEPAVPQKTLLFTNTVCVAPFPASALSPAMERVANATTAVRTKVVARRGARFARLTARIIRAGTNGRGLWIPPTVISHTFAVRAAALY